MVAALKVRDFAAAGEPKDKPKLRDRLTKRNNKMRYNIIIFICLLLIGCSLKKEDTMKKDGDTPMNQPLRSETSLKEAILINGDTDAYYELKIAYLDHPFQEEFLLYAMIMANKYNYPQAYFDVFDCFVLSYWSDITKIDEQSANLAIEYLTKAYDRGHHQAIEMVRKHSINRNENSKQQIERIFIKK